MRALLALVLLAAPAFAGDGAQSIACTGNSLCDAGGACTGGAADVAFRLTPVDVTATGDGAYRVAYGDVDAEAVMRPDKSLIWAEGRGDVQMLTLLDATRAIWVRRATLGTDGATSVTFLTCGEAG